MGQEQKIDEQRLPSEPACGYSEALGEHAANPMVPRTTGEAVYLFMDCEECGGNGLNPDNTDQECPLCKGKGHTGIVEEEFTLSNDEARLKAQFENWVKARGMRAIAELEGENPDMVRSMQAAYIADRAAGAYTWDGAACRAARSDVPGLRYLFFLLLRRCHPEMTEVKAADVFRRVPGQVARAMSWALGNPLTPSMKEGKNTNGVGRQTAATQTTQTTDNQHRHRSHQQGKTMNRPATLDGD